MSGSRVAVCADPPHDVSLKRRADELAQIIGIDSRPVSDTACDLQLVVTETTLELRVTRGEADLVGGRGVFADLAKIDTASPAGRRLGVPLLKAVGIKKGKPDRPNVIDCTAGLGEDAWLLAAHGCTVDAIERQPVVAALLDDALRRASRTHAETAQRITLHRDNATDWLRARAAEFKTKDRLGNAIVLDPMFPTGRKARERKPMRVLRMLAGGDDDAPALLDAAIQTGVHRVCVKRPLHAPALVHAERAEPDVVYKGKAVRFDVYLNR